MTNMNVQPNPWKTLSQKKIYDNPWISVEEHQVVNPGGKKGIYGKVHFKNRAIGIIPLDDLGNTWLVGHTVMCSMPGHGKFRKEEVPSVKTNLMRQGAS